MALIRIYSIKDLERLITKKIVDPSTHIVVVRFNTFYFAPIVTSRHRHYVIVRTKREEGKELFKMLANRGFTLIKGSLRFLVER